MNLASERSSGVNALGAPLILSPTGGGRRDGQTANTLISQQDDVPDGEEDFRSVSTLYNPPPQARGKPPKQLVQQNNYLQPEMLPGPGAAKVNSRHTAEKENAEVAEARAELEEQYSAAKQGDSKATDSFSQVFLKRRMAGGDEQSAASLATGERPWYYFEGNSMMSSHLNVTKQGSAMKASQRYLDQVEESDFDKVLDQPGRAANKGQAEHARLKSQTAGQKVATDGGAGRGEGHQFCSKPGSFARSSNDGAVDPLYSTSNVNTPNGRSKGKATNLAPPAHPPQLLGVPGATDTVSSGRMTLRSVHDTLTEELKARLENRRLEQG